MIRKMEIERFSLTSSNPFDQRGHHDRAEAFDAGLVVSIAEAHGGRLWTENNPAGDAKFNVAFPVSPLLVTETLRRLSRVRQARWKESEAWKL